MQLSRTMWKDTLNHYSMERHYAEVIFVHVVKITITMREAALRDRHLWERAGERGYLRRRSQLAERNEWEGTKRRLKRD